MVGMRAVAGSALALLCLATGCGDDAVAKAPPVTRTLDSGDGVLEISDAPSVTLSLGDRTLLRFGADAFVLGVMDQVDDDTNYDPYRLYVPHSLYTEPEDLRWLTPSGASIGEESDGSTYLELTYPEGQTARVLAGVAEPGRFWLRLVPNSEDNRTAFLRLAPRADAVEGFYGLGETFDSVNQRGQVRAMQLEADGSLEGTSNEAHVPVPLLTGSEGWGLFVESPYPGAFAVAIDDDERIEATFGTGTDSINGLKFELFAASHPLDVTRHYYQATGYPRLPARWALGPWVWRDENDDQAQVESDLDIIRDLDLATTGMWIDRPYATGVNTFDFEPGKFPDAQAMIAKMHALGFRTAIWHTPYLDENDPATAALRAEAEAAGYYPPDSALILNHWGRPIDLTNPQAVAWWREQLGAYVDLGVEGFKLDYGEDILNGPFDERTPWRFSNGSDERTMHSQFQRYYHDAYSELLPADGGFLLCRAGTYGDQQHGVIIWPGDLDASFAKFGDQVSDAGETYGAVGGLPASVIAGLSLGPSGFPFYGADTGGYRHSPTDKELFMRWFEQTALSTVMQIGTSANDVAWELGGANGFDQEMLDSYRRYTRLHLRLFPYLWSYATQLLEDGRPIQRALGLAHPELGVHPDDVYLLGDALLVAPVVERGVTSRTLPLPEGRWVHWFTGEIFEGPGEVTIDAPLGRLTLLLAQDGLVPLLRPTIDTLAPTSEPDRVDSYDDDAGDLYVRAVAGGSGTFALFDGGELELASSATSSTLSARRGNELFGATLFELLAASAPSSVPGVTEQPDLASLEGASEGWWYDSAAEVLWVKLAAGAEASATVDW